MEGWWRNRGVEGQGDREREGERADEKEQECGDREREKDRVTWGKGGGGGAEKHRLKTEREKGGEVCVWGGGVWGGGGGRGGPERQRLFTERVSWLVSAWSFNIPSADQGPPEQVTKSKYWVGPLSVRQSTVSVRCLSDKVLGRTAVRQSTG